MRAKVGLAVLASLLLLTLALGEWPLTVATGNPTGTKALKLNPFASPAPAQSPQADGALHQKQEIEIKKLVQDLGALEFKVREKATQRLAEIGPPSLEALQQLAEKTTDLEARTRALALIKSIRQAHQGPIAMRGMEFVLLTDTDWVFPMGKSKWEPMRGEREVPGLETNLFRKRVPAEEAQPTEVFFSLQITNTTDTPFSIRVLNNAKVILIDATANALLSLPGDSTVEQISAPLAKNACYALRFRGILTPSLGNLFTLRCVDPSGGCTYFGCYPCGTYRLSVVYQNAKPTSESGDLYWTGSVETLGRLITIK